VYVVLFAEVRVEVWLFYTLVLKGDKQLLSKMW